MELEHLERIETAGLAVLDRRAAEFTYAVMFDDEAELAKLRAEYRSNLLARSLPGTMTLTDDEQEIIRQLRELAC